MDPKTLEYMKAKVTESDKVLFAIEYRKKQLLVLENCEKVVKTSFHCDMGREKNRNEAVMNNGNSVIVFDFNTEIHAKAVELIEAEIILLKEMLEKI